jgi:chaperonin GroEL (HSP60 family)
MIQLSRTQDEEVGDGTTSVIILGENMPETILPSSEVGADVFTSAMCS